MKKYYLSLICAGVILGCAATAAGLSAMSSGSKNADNAGNQSPAAGRNISAPEVTGNIAPPPDTEQASGQVLITPSTKIIFESVYQADNKTKVTDESPPYFLLGLSQDKIQEYYPDWDIVEFDAGSVKLRRNISAETGDPYVLGVKDNYVAVYQKSGDGTVSLKEMTDTPVGALSQDDQNKLISGINVKSDAQLAQMLEDYGS